MAIFLTSDWHFNHDKTFIYEPRNFSTKEEHNLAIITLHNEVVSPDDDVYVLGDLMLGDNKEGIELIKKMNGNLHIILGNHDTSNRIKEYKNCPNVKSIQYAYRLKHGKWNFYLSHCPMVVAHEEDDKEKLWSLHGHTHSKNKFCDIPHCYNVALDAHYCCPVKIEKIIEDIRNRFLE